MEFINVGRREEPGGGSTFGPPQSRNAPEHLSSRAEIMPTPAAGWRPWTRLRGVSSSPGQGRRPLPRGSRPSAPPDGRPHEDAVAGPPAWRLCHERQTLLESMRAGDPWARSQPESLLPPGWRGCVLNPACDRRSARRPRPVRAGARWSPLGIIPRRAPVCTQRRGVVSTPSPRPATWDGQGSWIFHPGHPDERPGGLPSLGQSEPTMLGAPGRIDGDLPALGKKIALPGLLMPCCLAKTAIHIPASRTQALETGQKRRRRRAEGLAGPRRPSPPGIIRRGEWRRFWARRPRGGFLRIFKGRKKVAQFGTP